MKFKIKVEVMWDGSSHFFPMFKKNWWTPWRYIILRERSYSIYYGSKEAAEDVISTFLKRLQSGTVDHSYDIIIKNPKTE